MDFHELWQENRRWLLGVMAGGLLFWIASSVIAGAWDTTRLERQIARHRGAVRGRDFYDATALAAARTEQERLQAHRARLVEAQQLEATEEFSLEGKGDPDLHFDSVSRRVKRDILARAAALGVELDRDDLRWSAPVGEAIQPTLIALALLEQVAMRLLDAQEQVRGADPDALGLVAIDELALVAKAPARPRRAPAAWRAPGSRDEPDVEQLVQQHAVHFELRIDDPTLWLFLEQCAAGEPPIGIDTDFEVQVGPAPSDPLNASGTALAIELRAP